MSEAYIMVEVDNTSSMNEVFRLLRYLKEHDCVEDVKFEVD